MTWAPFRHRMTRAEYEIERDRRTAMTEPHDDYVGEGGDGTDPSLPEDAPLPSGDEPEQEEKP